MRAFARYTEVLGTRERGVFVYAKVFSSLWKGSLRGHPDPQHVFIYLLAHADEQGVVEAMPAAIADETGLALDAVQAAIAHLESPDPESRTPTHEGRRIQRLDEHRSWCWLITNYEHYRSLSDREKVRELTRERVRRFRERQVTRRNAPVTPETPGNAKQIQRQKVEGDPLSLSTPLDTSNPTNTNGHRREKTPTTGRLSDPVKVENVPDGELTADQAFHRIFWPRYPRKVAKVAAEKAWKALKLRDDDQSTLDAIMAGLARDQKSQWASRDPEKIPHASTWLNQRRWEDQP